MGPIIIVLNARFVGSIEQSTPYGVVGYARQLAPALRERRQGVKFLLYSRIHPDEPSSSQTIRRRMIMGFEAVEARMAFGSDADLDTTRFARALDLLLDSTSSGSTPPVVYHQSSVTLPFTPTGVICAVTHHAPFVAKIRSEFGAELTDRIFDDADGKVTKLEELQVASLHWLKRNINAIAVELSRVQIACLNDFGVSTHRCVRIAPPIDISARGFKTPPAIVRSWLRRHAKQILMFAATARVDASKNLEAIVDSFVTLGRSGKNPSLLLAVGDHGEEDRRRLLAQRVPEFLREHLVIIPRFKPDVLTAVLRSAAQRATFVCSSRYETLGITALEAMKAGVPLAIPDLPDRIGAVQYTPETFRYPSSEGLAAKILQLHAANKHGSASAMARRATRSLSPGDCADQFLDAVRSMRVI